MEVEKLERISPRSVCVRQLRVRLRLMQPEDQTPDLLTLLPHAVLWKPGVQPRGEVKVHHWVLESKSECSIRGRVRTQPINLSAPLALTTPPE